MADVSTTPAPESSNIKIDDLQTWLYISVGVLGGILILLVICIGILVYKTYVINRTVKQLKGTMDVYMRGNNQNLNLQQEVQPPKPRQQNDDNFDGLNFGGDNRQFSQSPKQVLPGRMGFQNQEPEREPQFGRPQNPQQPYKHAPQPLRLNLAEDNNRGQSGSYKNPIAAGRGGGQPWRDDDQNFNFGGLPRLNMNRNMSQSPSGSDYQRSRQIGY